MEKIRKPMAIFIISLVILLMPLYWYVWQDVAKNQKGSEFFFQGDKEITRIYYEGYISFSASNNAIEIILEDLEEDS